MQFGGIKKSVGSKNPSTLDLEVSRLRPRQINLERERLYDDNLKQKITSNFLKDENVKLKTKCHILEADLSKKEKIIDDLLLQQDPFGIPAPLTQNLKLSGKSKLDGHLATNLKRKIRDLQVLVQAKNDESEQLKRNIKSTKISEIEMEIKQYIDECTRLRHQLEEVIKSKDTFADPQELKAIEERFQQQEMLVNSLRNENNQLAQAYSKKEDENRQYRDMMSQ